MEKEIQVRGIVLGKGIPAIAVPLTAPRKGEILKEARAAREAGADLLEWRVDSYEDKSSENILMTLSALVEVIEPLPLIFTLRTKAEGGSTYEAAWKDYTALNLLAAKSGMADFVDVEVLRYGRKAVKLVQELKEEGVRVIASSHDFDKVPSREEILEDLRTLAQSEADVVKMAVMPASSEDTQRFMEAVAEFSAEAPVPIIAMAMGELGLESRINAECFGSCLTFGRVEAASAPGQPLVGKLKEELRRVHSGMMDGTDASGTR